jgi:hypothetical protein
MGTEQPRWYQIGNRQPRLKDGGDWTDRQRTTDNPEALMPTPAAAHERSPADCDGAMVARSQILVSGSTATLSGTMTNETDFDVYFSGMPPYASALDTDGNEPILLGDFSSPPREQPSSGDWVMHPGASVSYRSLPVTLQTPDTRWDGTHWSTSSQSTTLESTFCHQREVAAVQIIS